MFEKSHPSRPEQNGQRQDPEMTPSAIRKISMLRGIRRQLSLKKRSQAAEHIRSDTQHDTAQHNTSIQTSGESEVSLTGTNTSTPSKPTSRYTISSSAGSAVDTSASQFKPGNGSDMPRQAAIERPGSATNTNYCGKPVYVDPVADLDGYRVQTATVAPPLVGGDLHLRLEGLKQFKAWSEKIHESSLQHEEALRKAKSSGLEPKAPGDMVIVRHDLSSRHGAEVVERSVDAPTPFCSPQVTPVPVAFTSHAQKDCDLSHPASPPVLDLQSRLEPETPNKGRLRASSRTVIISSTPVAELERRSRSRSISESKGSRSRTESRHKEKKYPPISFPKIYNEKVSEGELFQTNSKPAPVHRTSSRKAITPSISPMTRPTVHDNNDVPDDQEPLATPHDKRGRPVFYSTVHYYTECTHASPPATRPLDPNAQPRQDPDFHPTRPEITRSIIPGMCFNCDTAYRREKENDVLNTCTGQIAEITHELGILVEQLELIDPDSSDEDESALDRHSAHLHTPHRFAEDEHDLRHQLSSMSLPPLSDDPGAAVSPRRKTPAQIAYQERITKRIRALEADIDKVQEAQDGQVRQVWAGYTRRWGPATLGVQRGPWSTNIERYQTRDDHDALLEHQRRSIEQRLAMPDELPPQDEDELQVVGVMDPDTEDGGLSAVSNEGSSVWISKRQPECKQERETHSVEYEDRHDGDECFVGFAARPAWVEDPRRREDEGWLD
ncbi:hypothetical protein LTR70_000461 [Exophiala xenobiotica]|uniref:Uncharacterized protein n=1 Tax=Lithohypha guttulata TaxID=1690604 RepID=A0ABR0KQY4_9EURO|nr:hypothetical protein LTR24_000162 [Lithohypha guttulata]KAK5330631.1 hypothetical protein LTR70_000461 [Exophiala xenobiotica]